MKTVLLVLLNLLVIPELESEKAGGKDKSSFVFAFEELENNLHPALLRRLFRCLEKYVLEEQATIFLTTHSSTALDFFGASEHAQVIRVSHDGESAQADPVRAHFGIVPCGVELREWQLPFPSTRSSMLRHVSHQAVGQVQCVQRADQVR